MIAVANASPICYLVLIGEIELLPKLFREVLVPRLVIEELIAGGAPAAVRI
jgi:predicted nucleic acid-binding protein